MKFFKDILSYYKISTLQEKVEQMGLELPIKVVWYYGVASVLFGVISGIALELDIIYILIITLAFILFIPSLILYRYTFIYQQNRFNEIVSYMEKLIYSYQKSGKIYTALKDVRNVTSKRVQDCLDEMIELIDEGAAEGNLYREAFNIIEEKYKCSRLQTLHSYLIDAETHGGDTEYGMDMLLDDIRSWAMRTTAYQNDRKNVRSKIVISIVLRIITCVASLHMVPSEYSDQMVVQIAYQSLTTICMLMFMILYILVQKSTSKSYLDYELDGNSEHLYEMAVKQLAGFDIKPIIRNSIIIIALGAVVTTVFYFLDYLGFALIADFILLVALYQPFHTRKMNRMRIENEFKKAIPVWMRNLTLQLQINNVNVSIQNSLELCPRVLKPEVEKLVKGISEKPGSIEPFDDFCKDYNLPDVKMSVNYLYYISTYGSDHVTNQLDYIIKQNSYMIINEENIRNKDSLSAMSLLILAPMIISIFKLLVDMMALFEVFNNLLNAYYTI